MERLKIETNKYLLMEILERIAEQEHKIVDCSPIIQLINDKQHLVRHSAIKALRLCNRCEAEEALIKMMLETKDEYDIHYATFVLNEMGTKKSIPYLIKLVEKSKGETKSCVIGTLSELGDNTLLPIFLTALQDRSPHVKSIAMSAIAKHGDESAVQPIVHRVKNMLKRERIIQSDDLLVAFNFLKLFKNSNKEIDDLFSWLKTKKWNFLFEDEKHWLNENIP